MMHHIDTLFPYILVETAAFGAFALLTSFSTNNSFILLYIPISLYLPVINAQSFADMSQFAAE